MVEKSILMQPSFSNKVIDKSQLKELVVWAFRTYGIARAANMADKLKDLGFYYATKAGISLSLEDLRIPPAKKALLDITMKSITSTDSKYYRGEITAVERFQKVIDTWNSASEDLKKEVIGYFKETDPLNPIYMMAFSGARGNISQVRQLVGMRGLMSDPQGQIIDLPISSNFREGLTITDYFISSYGARKGLVDTALRTADSGYLTRRLVDVSQDVIIREIDCKTSRGIVLEDMIENQKSLISLKQALLGRVLADDLYDPINHVVIAKTNQDIGPALAQNIIEARITKVLVRSPITCNAIGSVCQLCYGWNLAHGKIVDLGEAVGIIAAQSIGEPGTQLTMRTFHTGGVFTGELAQSIYAPEDVVVEYPDPNSFSEIRTRHGEKACLVNDDCKLFFRKQDDSVITIDLSKGTILLVTNNSTAKKGKVIAEYPLSNRLITERAQKSILADFSGKVQFTNLTVEEIQNKQYTIRIAQKEGLVWILSGKTYRIPDNTDLLVSCGDKIIKGTVLATTKIVSQYDGLVQFLNSSSDDYSKIGQDITIVTAFKLFQESIVYFDSSISNGSYVFKIHNHDRFVLYVESDQVVSDKQIIGELISETYFTQTGGIVKYLDLSVSKKKNNELQEGYDILGQGYILWISEETHEINKDISLLLVTNGDFVEAGTEIVKNIFAKNSGIVEVIQQEEIILEIIIKPGDIYVIKDHLQNISKRRGFLRPGETVVEGITTNKLVYWEYINTKDKNYILIRPVIVYSIPNKTYEFGATSQFNDNLNLSTLKRTPFQDGERVKSVNGVNLIQTYLLINIMKNDTKLNCKVEFQVSKKDPDKYCLHFIIADRLSFKANTTYESTEFSRKTTLLVEDDQVVSPNTVIAQTEILSLSNGDVEHVDNISLYNRRLMIVTDLDQKVFNIPSGNIKVSVNDWICAGDEIADSLISFDSGKITSITDNQVIMRIGRPYLVSNGTILHVNNDHLVQRGENLATLIFERPKTGDIVQGLPRIEEILEARKKSDNGFNPHNILESSFRSYLAIGLNLYNATILSIEEIQLFLVKEVQLVYQSQGVDISDKHVEVIVRQMTSKVKIEMGGDTDYLPGEIIELQKIYAVNNTMSILQQNEATYHPILLGITKASLNTESFISAASFQETTKVLTEAAISGKLDWLKGLKENVIIGRLIPAGTGFNIYNKYFNGNSDVHKMIASEMNISQISQTQEKSDTLKSNIDDIILDDRSARDYPLSHNE